jgi:hypothetical protein
MGACVKCGSPTFIEGVGIVEHFQGELGPSPRECSESQKQFSLRMK